MKKKNYLLPVVPASATAQHTKKTGCWCRPCQWRAKSITWIFSKLQVGWMGGCTSILGICSILFMQELWFFSKHPNVSKYL